MPESKPCLLCRAQHCADSYDQNRTVSGLSLFRTRVRELEEALARDPHYFDKGNCRHAQQTDEKNFGEVSIAVSQADVQQRPVLVMSSTLAPITPRDRLLGLALLGMIDRKLQNR